MILNYYIVGGTIKIHKNVFIQELLSRDSKLRALLNWKNTGDFSIKHPLLNETDQNGMVTIQFNSESEVMIDQPPKELLTDLKAKYKERIKGRINCRVEYSTFGGMFHYQIDLDSDNGDIEYIHN